MNQNREPESLTFFYSWLLNLKDYKITVEGTFLILLLFLKLTKLCRFRTQCGVPP